MVAQLEPTRTIQRELQVAWALAPRTWQRGVEKCCEQLIDRRAAAGRTGRSPLSLLEAKTSNALLLAVTQESPITPGIRPREAARQCWAVELRS